LPSTADLLEYLSRAGEMAAVVADVLLIELEPLAELEVCGQHHRDRRNRLTAAHAIVQARHDLHFQCCLFRCGAVPTTICAIEIR
jgi:hypothetical protein